MRSLRWRHVGAGLRGPSPLVVVLSLFALLFTAQTARANSMTPQQYLKDLGTVNAEIAANPGAFDDSAAALHDYAAAVVAGALGIADLLHHNSSGAQTEFEIALHDFNGVLLVLGDPQLPGGDPAPEPSSLLQLGLGMGAVLFVFGRRQRQEKRRRAALASAL